MISEQCSRIIGNRFRRALLLVLAKFDLFATPFQRLNEASCAGPPYESFRAFYRVFRG